MTITAQTAKSGPYSGNGSTTVFDYTFKVDDESHLVVTVLGTDGVSESTEVLNTDYTVTGVGNPSGGTIVMSVAPIVGEKLTITRNVALTQEVDLQNRGAVNPETLELAYDKLTQISQDQQEQLSRSLKVDLFETADLNQLTLNVNALAAIEGDISTVANISPDVTTVAGVDTEVTTVSGISADVTTVSGISADVTTVAADGTDIGVVAGISADVTTVSGISADVTTVSGISADVTTVAADGTDIGVVAGISADVSTVSGISADVTTVAADGTDIGVVAGISADVTTVAANVADVTNFADVYLGPSATDPTLRNDGTALQEGDLYFNTTNDVMNVYEGTEWVAAFASLSGALIATNNLSDLDDASVALTNLGVTATAAELNFVDGVTSNIQTQINARLKSDDKATQAEAEAGTDNSVYMTPLRTAQAIEELAGGGGFEPTTVSGATQALDLGSFNFFDAGTLTADTTVSFSNVPTEARWTYTFIGDLLTSYSIENAFYDSVSFSVAVQDTFPQGIFFKPDGSKMYIVGGSNDSVFQYTLSTAWDLSTAFYDSVSFSVAGQDATPTGIFFKDDGTKMYMVGSDSDAVYQYTLSTAWDLSTASYDSVSFSVAGQDATPTGIFFKDDGTKMYMVGSGSDAVHQYTLSTAWDLSTASYDSVSFSVAGQEAVPLGIFFKGDGTKMYMVGRVIDAVHQYTLSTAWDLSTASYDSVSFSVAGQDTSSASIFFKDDGTKMYMVGYGINAVHQYTVGDYTTMTLPASVQNPPTEPFGADKVTYEFYTLDGGTNVYLINEEVL